MDNTAENAYLENLAEFIYDEDKIVTCTWLSTKLGITVNQAETLLQKYVRNVRKTKPNDLSINYVILGTKHGNNLAVTLSKECDLVEKRAAYEKVTSEHVYSVQKIKDVDLSVLFLVEPFSAHNIREKPMLGSIIGKNCVKRVLKIKKVAPTEKPKEDKLFAKKTPSAGDVESGHITDAKTNQKENGITSLFTKAQSEGRIKDKKTLNKNEKKSNGIMNNFFTKVAQKTNEQNGNGNNSTKEVAKIIEPKQENEDKVEPVTEKKKENEVKVEATDKKVENKKAKRPRKNNKSGQAQKKRKRIVERNDSDSDDIFGDDDDDGGGENDLEDSRKRRLSSADEVSNTTDDESVPVNQQPPKPVNKRRKYVMRTFTDEDGYVVTRKDWVVEDECVDEEKENSHNKVAPMEIGSTKIQSEMSTTSSLKGEGKKQSENDETDNDSKTTESRKNTTNEEAPSKAASKKKGKPDKKPTNQQTLLSFFKKA